MSSEGNPSVQRPHLCGAQLSLMVFKVISNSQIAGDQGEKNAVLHIHLVIYVIRKHSFQGVIPEIHSCVSSFICQSQLDTHGMEISVLVNASVLVPGRRRIQTRCKNVVKEIIKWLGKEFSIRG